MASGTYNFALSNASILIEGFSRCGIRRTALLAEHIEDGRVAINLAMQKFSVLIPNLFAEEDYVLSLVASTATYTLPARTNMILSCFIRTGSGSSQQDRIAWPLSQYEYASLPNKAAEGFPTQFWLARLAIPQLSFYLVPDSAQAYTAHLQIARQLQDANLPGGETPDVPNRFLDALCAEVGHRLSRVYAPEKETLRKADAAEAWAIAATNDTENVSMNIVPTIGVYRA